MRLIKLVSLVCGAMCRRCGSVDEKRLRRALRKLLDGDRLDLWASGGRLLLMPNSRIWLLALPKIREVASILDELEARRSDSRLSVKPEGIWGSSGFAVEFWVDSKFWGLLGYLLRRGMLGDADVVFTASHFEHWGLYGLWKVATPDGRLVIFFFEVGGVLTGVYVAEKKDSGWSVKRLWTHLAVLPRERAGQVDAVYAKLGELYGEGASG